MNTFANINAMNRLQLLAKVTELGVKTPRPPHMMKTEDLRTVIPIKTVKAEKSDKTRTKRSDTIRAYVLSLVATGLDKKGIMEALEREGKAVREFYVYTILRSLK